MSSFKWSKRNAVYIPEFDQQHKNIFRMAEQLYESLQEGARLSALEPLVRALTSEARGHFRSEEKRMESVRYPLTAWHKRQHNAARATTAAVSRSAREGDREGVLEGLEALVKWLGGHTAVTDRMMTAYVRDYGRSHG